jgi:uncharacterized protein involved in response to NO
LIAIVSGVVLAISSFLEWAAVEVTPGFEVTVSGTDGSDGWITLACGAIGVAAGAMSYTAGPKGKLPGVLAIIAGVIGLAVGVINLGEAEGYQSYGLYLVIIGGIGVAVAGVMLLRSRTETTTATTGTDVPPGGPPTV